jgi:hypothetical protein
MKRLALVAASLVLAACSGASKDSGPEEILDDPDASTSQDGAPLDDTSGAGFDVSSDTNVGDGKITGDAACAKTEAMAIKPPVDLIIAVDQSGSMSDDIANVKSNINKLSDNLKATGLDYRVIMIASPGTTTYSVCVPPPLGGATCGAENPPIFKQVPQNVQSTDALTRILQTYDGAPGPYSASLRTGAVKAIIPITDDNSSLAAASFDTQLLAKPGGQFGTAAKRNYVVYPIMGAPAYPMESPKCGINAVNTGTQYIALVKLVGGGSKWFPICLTDFAPVFAEMAKSIATRVACELTIPPPPMGEKLDPDKVNVTYTPGTGGAPETLLKDESKPCDAGANGWQYSPDKTKIYLCGDACKKVQADLKAKVTVEFGCETKFRPPS